MFLTSVNELIQHYFLSSRTLHNDLSVIGLFMNPYVYLEHILSWLLYIWQENSQEEFGNALYSVYMLNGQSNMQAQIVLTVAVLSGRHSSDIIGITKKNENQWSPTPMNWHILTTAVGNVMVILIRQCLHFLVLINSDIGGKGGATDWTWYIAEAYYAFEHVSFRQGKYITFKFTLF